jgi:hypothetical protein
MSPPIQRHVHPPLSPTPTVKPWLELGDDPSTRARSTPLGGGIRFSSLSELECPRRSTISSKPLRQSPDREALVPIGDSVHRSGGRDMRGTARSGVPKAGRNGRWGSGRMSDLKASNFIDLVGRHHLGEDSVDPSVPSDRHGCRAVVPGHHRGFDEPRTAGSDTRAGLRPRPFSSGAAPAFDARLLRHERNVCLFGFGWCV